MWQYLIMLGVILTVLPITHFGERRIVFVLLVFALALLAGLRIGIGSDYYSYRQIYYATGGSTGRLEIGYGLLSKAFHSMGFSFEWLIFVIGIGVAVILARFIRDFSPWPLFSLFLYFCSGYYFLQYNAIRQFIAMSFGLVAIGSITEKKYLKSIVIWAFAAFFHKSALLIAPVFYLGSFSLFLGRPRLLAAACLLTLVIGCLPASFFLGLLQRTPYSDYSTTIFAGQRSGIAILKQLVPSMIVVGISSLHKKDAFSSRDTIILNLYILGVLYLNAFCGIQLFIRLGYYLDILMIVAIPILFRQLRGGARYFIYLVGLYYIAYFVVTIILMKGQGVWPYRSIIG
jgi:uncharacterized membrane protein